MKFLDLAPSARQIPLQTQRPTAGPRECGQAILPPRDGAVQVGGPLPWPHLTTPRVRKIQGPLRPLACYSPRVSVECVWRGGGKHHGFGKMVWSMQRVIWLGDVGHTTTIGKMIASMT